MCIRDRNNRQNDKLTRSADHRDIWLHTQKIHGSHVILCTGGREVDDDTIVEAAKLAAWFSQAREGANVPVDYTPVKNVKKPAGARPGICLLYTSPPWDRWTMRTDPSFVSSMGVETSAESTAAHWRRAERLRASASHTTNTIVCRMPSGKRTALPAAICTPMAVMLRWIC